MKREYDLSKMKRRENPYAKQLCESTERDTTSRLPCQFICNKGRVVGVLKL